jgi:hypothetical protein
MKVTYPFLKEIYDLKSKFDKKILTNIADELTLFYKKCGLSMSNVRKGVYIAVKMPDF